jgi:hypothetical protein
MLIQPFHIPTFSQQLVEGDRQVADALAGRVKNGVGDCRRDADDAHLAQAFDAEWIDNRIVFFDEYPIDIMDIGGDRHTILRQVMVHEPPAGIVDYALRFQRHADAPDAAAEYLAARRLRVQDAASRHRAEHSYQATRQRERRPARGSRQQGTPNASWPRMGLWRNTFAHAIIDVLLRNTVRS